MVAFEYMVCGILFVIYSSSVFSRGPICLRCWMLTLLGHVQFLLCFIVSWTCFVVSFIVVVCSLCVFLPMCLFVKCVRYLRIFLKSRFIEINKNIYIIVEKKDIMNTFRVKRNEREESMAAIMIIK